MPKSEIQARAEVVVTRKMIENFSGDQVSLFSSSSIFVKSHKIRKIDFPGYLIWKWAIFPSKTCNYFFYWLFLNFFNWISIKEPQSEADHLAGINFRKVTNKSN